MCALFAHRSPGAHPRVGGENPEGVQDVLTNWGSSPRGRGKLSIGAGIAFALRLIPAWAGKTLFFQSSALLGWAHPRVGGENVRVIPVRGSTAGSSPRGRGKQVKYRPSYMTYRLIPAWAGKTPSTGAFRGRWRAHPRVGGENYQDEIKISLLIGSSPRGRGKQRGGGFDERGARLIPAWAGKTLCFIGLSPSC